MTYLSLNPFALKKGPFGQDIYYMCGVICFVILFSPFSYGMENMSPGDAKNQGALAIQDVEKMVCNNFSLTPYLVIWNVINP